MFLMLFRVLQIKGFMVYSVVLDEAAERYITHVKNLHGIPWNFIDFHGKFSMEFHGGLGHQFPWNSMEISP